MSTPLPHIPSGMPPMFEPEPRPDTTQADTEAARREIEGEQ